MARYPGATFVPTAWGGKTKRNRQGRGILHVAVNLRKSLPPWNANTWHFYVAREAPDGSTDGSGGPAYCEQYVDTDFRAYGAVDSNDDALIVETAGGMGTSKQLNVEKWTRAQELRLADIMRWESKQPGGAPLELLPDSKAGRQGWGPHRLGIKHSAGAVPGWWAPGGEVWSNALGKECPGDAKVAQVPGIVVLARTGSAASEGWLDVATAAELMKVVQHLEKMLASVGQYVVGIAAKQAASDAVLKQLAAKQGTAIDMAAIEAVVEKGVSDAIAAIDTTVSIETKD